MNLFLEEFVLNARIKFEKAEDEVALKSLRMTDAHYPTDSTWGYTEARQKKKCKLSRE